MRYTPIAGAVAVAVLGLSQTVQASDFVADSKATLDTRNFYINQDNRSGDAAPSYGEEWGQGFVLNFQSGYTDGPIGLGLDALAQARGLPPALWWEVVSGPEDHDGLLYVGLLLFRYLLMF